MPSRRRCLVTAAALLLLFASAPTLAQSGPGGGPGSDGERPPDHAPANGLNETDQPDTDDDANATGRDDAPGQARQGNATEDRSKNRTGFADESPGKGHGKDRSDEAKGHGRSPHAVLGAVHGRFVGFNATTSGVTEVRIMGVLVFANVSYAPAPGFGDVERHGAAYRLDGDDARIDLIDNPTAQLRVKGDGAATFRLAAGLSFVPAGTGHDVVGPDGVLGHLAADDAVLVDAQTLLAPDDARYKSGPDVTKPGRPAAIDDAIGDRRVAAEIKVAQAKGGPKADPVSYGPYDLTIDTSSTGVVVTIDGEGEGRTLLFDLERDAIGRVEDLVIRFDGQVIHPADDLADVLNASADEPAEYIILVGRNSTQVLVQIPHFSVHTIELQSVFVGLPAVAPGSLAALLAATVVAAAFVGATWTMRTRQR